MLTVAFREYTMSRTQIQLWYNQFEKGREDVNAKLVLVARARQHPIVTMKKMILEIVESLLKRLLMMLAYRSAHAKQFLRMFKAAKIVSKLLNFEPKQCSMDIAH